MKIDETNAADLVGDADGIVDAMDNYQTRYLLNEVAIEKNIPLFHGAITGILWPGNHDYTRHYPLPEMHLPQSASPGGVPCCGSYTRNYRDDSGQRSDQVPAGQRRAVNQPALHLGRDAGARRGDLCGTPPCLHGVQW